MKRLKHFLLQMENTTTTYREMYEGKTVIPPCTYGNPTAFPDVQYDPVYWHNGMSVKIMRTHKLALDKPTLIWQIPIEKLGFESCNCTPAAADFCLRALKPYIDNLNAELYNRSRPDNENGKYYICIPGGEVLIRNTAYFSLCPQKDYRNGSGTTIYLLDDDIAKPPQMCLCLCIQVQLPKAKIRKALQMLCKDLPEALDLFVSDFDANELNKALTLEKTQNEIRNRLKNSDYCAFIANGSILPRSKGTDLPLNAAIPFKSTPDDEIEICGIRGMGIKRGVTIITGGAYSGKSTLLDAISAGIYNHVSGDGRELCITDESAMTISAEDGRSVKHLNVSPFIKWLPQGDTSDFSTDHASGSTSQAANIMEAVDFGVKLLLIDEDKSATNFMIRDKMMKELIVKEPITPFTDRVNELYKNCGVSTILVIGGSGEYLSVSDKIYMMEDFLIHDVTGQSKLICQKYNSEITPPATAVWEQKRVLLSDGFTSYPEGMGSEKMEVSDLGFIMIGDEQIDIRGLHDIITPRQLFTLGFMLRHLEVSNNTDEIPLTERINALYDKIGSEGLDSIHSSYFTKGERFLDLPRKQELLAVINRMRKVHFT